MKGRCKHVLYLLRLSVSFPAAGLGAVGGAAPARPPGGSAGGQSALLLDQLRPLPDLDAGGRRCHLADRFAAGPAGYFVRHHPAGTFPRRTQNLQKTADRRQTSGGWGRRSGSAGGLSLAEILALCGPQHCRPAGPDAGRPFADGAILCAAAGHQLCHADGGGVSGGCLPGQLPPGGPLLAGAFLPLLLAPCGGRSLRPVGQPVRAASGPAPALLQKSHLRGAARGLGPLQKNGHRRPGQHVCQGGL